MPMDDGPTGSLAEVFPGLSAPPLLAVGRRNEVIALVLAHMPTCTLDDARMLAGTGLVCGYSYRSARLSICAGKWLSSRTMLDIDSLLLATIMRAPIQALFPQLVTPCGPVQLRLLLEYPQGTKGASNMDEVNYHAKHLHCR
jgi:hypothetical protein